MFFYTIFIININNNHKLNRSYNKNIIQKRTIIYTGYSTIGGVGVIGTLTYLFFGLAFSLVVFGLPEDNLGSGGTSGFSNRTTFNNVQNIIYNLQNTLDHVDRIRRVNMSMIKDIYQVLSFRADVFGANTTFVSNNYPEILNLYRDTIIYLVVNIYP